MSNEILLYGEIGPGGITAQQVKHQLAQMDQSQLLVVRIDSEGGSVFDGFSMYEAFASYQGPKKAVIESTAFSIASYIAMAFDEVEIASNGYLMIHSPRTEAGGTAEELIDKASVLAKLKKSMTEAYSKKAGISEEDAVALMAKDTFLNAEEALAKGLVSRINQIRASTRIAPQAHHKKLPQRVFAALFGADPAGDTREQTQEQPMSNANQPVAATVSEIKAAFPKAKSDFIVKCLEKQLPMASVATEAHAELATENESLLAQIESLTSELEALKAAPPVESLEPVARGAKPVARAQVPVAKSAKEEWDTAVNGFFAQVSDRPKAVAMANRQYPGLRQRMLAEVNAR